jgi:hypothetical protein
MLADVVRLLPALLLAAALAFCAPADAAVPDDFVGMIIDGPMLTTDVDVDDELDVMEKTGVQSVRFSIYWNELRPYRRAGEVPAALKDRFPTVDGVPTDFSSLDAFVQKATGHGFDLLPVVLRTPEWARRTPSDIHSSPTDLGREAYASFMSALVHRYGPDGDYWDEHPYDTPRPIRRWQVWNEPNGPLFWSEQPGIAAYVKLLLEAEDAIHKADPDAQVVLAGLFGKAWKPLRRVYAFGGGGAFDVAAVNPFTLKVSNVMLIIRRARVIMDRNGDQSKKLLATEISWPTAKGKARFPYGFEVTEKQQAQRVRSIVPKLARQRRKLGLGGFFWSSWVSYDRNKKSSFDYAGLRRATGKRQKVVAKPGYFAFKKVVKRLTR